MTKLFYPSVITRWLQKSGGAEYNSLSIYNCTNTVRLNETGTIVILWYKGYCFEIAKLKFKMQLCPQSSGSKEIWNRSFKWGIKQWFLSRGCKDIRCQSWRLRKYLLISPVQTHASGVSRVGRYFFQPPTLTSDIFAAC